MGQQSSEEGGSIHTQATTFLRISESEITDSQTRLHGGAIFVSDAVAQIDRVSIGNSRAMKSGGALFAQRSTVNISECTITNTTAQMGGGVSTSESSLITSYMTFQHCSAESRGGILHSVQSILSMNDTLAVYSSASQGAMYLSSSQAFFHSTQHRSNRGSLFVAASTITFRGNTTFTNCSTVQVAQMGNQGHASIEEGGALTAFKSIIETYGTVSLTNNHADIGGAIHLTESVIHANGQITVSNNTAERNGGGIYLYLSELNCLPYSACDIIGNIAMLNGGGVQALSSTITGYSVVNINHNRATRGGALSLESNAKVSATKTIANYRSDIRSNYDGDPVPILNFISNTADYGGAVYVSDETSSVCASTSNRIWSAATECFYQPFALHNVLYEDLDFLSTNFADNHARVSGANLFGGLLDRCTVSPYAEFYSGANPLDPSIPPVIDGVTSLLRSSNLDGIDTIASNPVRICFCKDGLLDCSFQPSTIRVKKGESFVVSLVAVDQVNYTVSSMIITSLGSSRGGLGEDQTLQSSTESCSNLEFNVFSPLDSDDLVFFPVGPCNYTSFSQRRVHIEFLPCTCPDSYVPKDDEETKCICES